MTWLINLWWRVVFWWKRRTGWLDLGTTIEVVGEVLEIVPPDIDGDRAFNLRLESGRVQNAPRWTSGEQFITGFGGRLTAENPALGPSLHCEIPPWSKDALKTTYDELKVGDRVRAAGAWGFDGVHLGYSMWVEVPAALIRHQPNVRAGWFECHPVTVLGKLEATRV